MLNVIMKEFGMCRILLRDAREKGTGIDVDIQRNTLFR